MGAELDEQLLAEAVATRVRMNVDGVVADALFNDLTVDAISDLDLSCTPPLGSPWDALQTGAQAWARAHSTAPLVRLRAADG